MGHSSANGILWLWKIYKQVAGIHRIMQWCLETFSIWYSLQESIEITACASSTYIKP